MPRPPLAQQVVLTGEGRRVIRGTPLKTNMAMENHHLKYEIHLQIVDFPLPC